MLNTKTYSTLLRDTAEANGVTLLKGRWTDGTGRGANRTIGGKRRVTFIVDTIQGDVDQFMEDLSIQTALINGNAPTLNRHHGFAYVRFVCELG